MIRVLVATLAITLAGPVHATQNAIPGLYDVTGVEANDVLNIRAAPDPGSEIIGTLAPDATGIEVVATSGDERWGLVNTNEQSGWASLAFLVPRPGEWDGHIPERLACFGTEPFWSLEIEPEGKVFEQAGLDAISFPGAGDRVPASGRRDRWSLRDFEEGQSLTAVIVTRACSDGMSDRAFGLSVDVLLSTSDGHEHVAGCCSLVAGDGP